MLAPGERGEPSAAAARAVAPATRPRARTMLGLVAIALRQYEFIQKYSNCQSLCTKSPDIYYTKSK